MPRIAAPVLSASAASGARARRAACTLAAVAPGTSDRAGRTLRAMGANCRPSYTANSLPIARLSQPFALNGYTFDAPEAPEIRQVDNAPRFFVCLENVLV